MQLEIQFLAGPRLRIGQDWTPLPITRPLLLLSFVTFREDWVSRDELLALFWPDLRETRARQNLRALLYRCKKEVFGAALELERTRVRCLADSDVHTFREAVSRGDWNAAVRSYQGAFLERVRADDSADFEAWLENARDEFHTAWRGAALNVATELGGRGQHRQAVTLLQRVLHHDGLAEDVVQACMEAQARAGQRDQALATFEAFTRLLGRELAMTPLQGTRALADAIRRNEFTTPSVPAVAAALGAITDARQGATTDARPGASPATAAAGPKRAPFSDPVAAPQPLTPFIGRTLEVLELGHLLADPRNHLVTLLGPGGMGKTRLSFRLLEEHAGRFEHGGAFVPLAHVQAASDVPHAIASSLRLEVSGTEPIEQGLLHYLRDKQMLIVLDNVEQLLSGVAFIERLVRTATRCSFLVTSRALLGLPNEVVYDLAGMTIPASDLEDNLEAYDAAHLFVRSARRIRSDFSVQRSDQPALFELCRRLNGMPLALELAANWVRVYSLVDLVGALRDDVDLLEATGSEVSDRHRSLRTVFEHSWRLLSPESKRVLAALAVFHGGFDRQAANAVTGASAKTLLALVNTSLVRRTASGRFVVLSVIRQYAAEKHREQADTVRERHGTYYLELLGSATTVLEGPAPKPALTALELELDNLRAAWHWAWDARRFGLSVGALPGLRAFFSARAHLREGFAFLKHAWEAAAAMPESVFGAQLQLELAFYSRRLDLQLEARAHAEEALRIARAVPGSDVLEIESRCELAIIGCWVGDFEDSARHAEQALALAEAMKHEELSVRSRARLALAKRYLGAFDEAHALYRSVLAHQRRNGQQIEMLRSLSDLGRLLVDMDRPVEAAPLFQEGLELAQHHDVLFELGFMWEGLSQCSQQLGDFPLATQQAETALRCSEAVQDTMGVAVQCAELAKICLATEDPRQAEAYLRRGLTIAWHKQEIPEVMRLLLIWAELLVQEDAWQRAYPLFSQVAMHPGAQAVHKRAAQAWLGHSALASFTAPTGSLADMTDDLLGIA